MRIKTALLPVLAAGSVLLGAKDIYPGGDFESGKMPVMSARRYVTEAGKRAAAPAGVVTEKIQSDKIINGKYSLLLQASEKGIHEWHFPTMAVTPGKKYKFSVNYLVEEANPKFEISSRLVQLRNNAKALYRFSKGKVAVGKVMQLSTEFTAAENAHSVSIVLWVNNGPYKVYIDDLKLVEIEGGADAKAEAKPAAAAVPQPTTGELFPAGDFEGDSYAPMGIRQLSVQDGKRVNAPKGTVTAEIQDAKAFAGKKSLLLTAAKDGLHDLNLNNLPVKAGKKYTFSFRYFIEEHTEKFYIACRMNMVRKGQKPVNSFPKGKVATGQWMTLQTTFYPPADTEKMHLTIWVGRGPYKVYIDDVKITEIAEAQTADKDSNTALIMQDQQLTVWKQSNYRRIDAGKMPANLKKSNEIALECAANEREPFQLAIYPKKKIENLSLEISDLTGKSGVIASSLQSYGIVRYAFMQNPNNPTLKGEVADPITDEKVTDAPAGKNTIFFVRLFAPKGTPAGVYNGTLTLKSGSDVLCKVPLKLKVRNFELPDTPAIRSLFYANPGMVKSGYKDIRPMQDIVDDLSLLLKDHRITGSQCILTPVPEYVISGDKLTVTNWSRFDSIVKRMYEEHGVRDFTMSVLRVFGFSQGWRSKKMIIFGEDFFSEKARKLSADYARQFHEHWMKTMPADALYYCYIYDEAPEKVYAELNKFMDYVKERVPEFRFSMTHEVEPKLKGIDVFIVPFSYAYVKPEMEKGREIWYYNWSQPLAHSNYIRNRLYSWQIYANGGRGGLKWQTSHISGNSNPWKTLDRTYNDGDATTIYPAITAGGKLVPSLRLAQVREAVDDGDYLKLLEKEVEKSFPGSGKNYVYNFIRELLPELPFAYTNDSELLYQMRSRLADEIENFNNAPVVLVTSEPLHNSVVELPEIKFNICGPNGAKVFLNGKAAGTIKNDICKLDYTLSKLGKNCLQIKVVHQGKSKAYNFIYTLKQDANLKKLAALTKEMQSLKLDCKAAADFLKKVEKVPYNEKMRTFCAKLTAEYAQKIMGHKLQQLKKTGNVLVDALQNQAQAMFKYNLFNRTDYYMALSKAFARYQLPADSNMKIEPVMLHGNFGFKISNGIIEFVLLEMGGRVVSFKVNGVETLNAGDLDKSLPPEIRAGRRYDKFTYRNIPFLGGYEDAGLFVIPESAVDWDIAIKEISNKRIALECSILMQDKKFKISRTMICEANSPELKIQYNISNVFPSDFKSDDPTHYHLNWRARLIPQIGKSRQGDELSIPANIKLPATKFDSSNPVFWEKRSVLLQKPEMRVSDTGEKTALVWQIDPQQINYAYIWFDSKGKSPVYTLEVFRSFFGNSPGAEANTPFYIEPGKSVKFNVTLKGVRL